ncbi:putative quinol monooxygenase [Arcobacter arenosus]|uniref:Antibiotic biosynthesis monooxygenase n=1 Tax=Arcobacter arenosus TaxID=2576037 RepID=A0A5R8Y1U4_9BACT|nr:putative quinol monooxygenase [Arcobacter arenosus]TLP39305.1 antibiotic biosynthesis monooxygenase [Arcobacter arenosus]
MSKKIYCIASFKAKEGKEQELLKTLQSLEPQTTREDGCIQYIVTKHIEHPNAMGKSFPIVFNEIWESKEAFELHCNKPYITNFFETHCVDKNGLVEDFNVCVYTDEVN